MLLLHNQLQRPVRDQVLVRQYRHAVGDLSLELPAGCLDKPGEEVAAAALRELQEETGRTAAQLSYLGAFHASPGFTTETTHLFAAEGLSDVGGTPDDDEFLEVVKVPLAEALAMARRGSIRDAKTICGLLWYQTWGNVGLQAPPSRGTLADD